MTVENVGLVLMVNTLPVRVRVRECGVGMGVVLEYRTVVAIDSNPEVTEGLVLKAVVYEGSLVTTLKNHRVCVNLENLPEVESDWVEIAYLEPQVGGPDLLTYARSRIERAESLLSKRRWFKGIGTTLGLAVLYGGYRLLKR